jgi:hypothetical protein
VASRTLYRFLVVLVVAALAYPSAGGCSFADDKDDSSASETSHTTAAGDGDSELSFSDECQDEYVRYLKAELGTDSLDEDRLVLLGVTYCAKLQFGFSIQSSEEMLANELRGVAAPGRGRRRLLTQSQQRPVGSTVSVDPGPPLGSNGEEEVRVTCLYGHPETRDPLDVRLRSCADWLLCSP